MRRIERTGKFTLLCMAAGSILAISSCIAEKAKSQTMIPGASGNAMVRWCSPPPSTDQTVAFLAVGGCMGYLTAVLDMLGSGVEVGGRRACVPPGVDQNQMVDLVKGYIQEHPESRHLPAYVLISRAFSVHFPCR